MLPALLFLAALPVSAELSWQNALPPALKEAAAEKKLVLLDFQAPWCYSCYYMESHVLSGRRFADASDPFVLVKLDVDGDEGHALREKYAVTFLPTYVVLDGRGREKGRILGEQTENDFIDKIAAVERGEARDDEALAQLRRRLKEGDAGALEKLLDRPATCDTAYDVAYGDRALEKVSAPRRAKILADEKTALESLVQSKIFVEPDRRCADFRTAVEDLADVDDKLGLADKKKELLTRAVETMTGLAKTGEDRNRDDNLRFFLELLDDAPRLRVFYKELIAAYPSDYVYSYRYARWLERHGQPEDALAWIEEADKLCYGANRLAVTEVRARILVDLGRKDEARSLLRRDYRAGRRSFPAEAAALQKLLDTL